MLVDLTPAQSYITFRKSAAVMEPSANAASPTEYRDKPCR